MRIDRNGDGGGGPLPDMLERVGRMRNTLGLPRMKFSHPDAFFDELKATAGDKLLTVRWHSVRGGRKYCAGIKLGFSTLGPPQGAVRSGWASCTWSCTAARTRRRRS